MKHSVRFCLLATSLCISGAHGADSYGRLFTSPAQRAELDDRFAAHRADEADVEGEPQPRTADRPLRLNGTLIGSSGRKEVWINGQSASDLTNPPVVRVLSSERVQIKPSGSLPPATMKPGQVLDTTTGQVSEPYLNKTIPGS